MSKVEKKPEKIFRDRTIFFARVGEDLDLAQHADKLTPGQIALVKSYDGYVMNVYATRRSCALPEADYENVKRNAREASVDEECFVTGGMWSPLFPLPENGCQVVQNGRISIMNGLTAVDRVEATLIPTKSGSFVPIRRRQVLYNRTLEPKFKTFEDLDGV